MTTASTATVISLGAPASVFDPESGNASSNGYLAGFAGITTSAQTLEEIGVVWQSATVSYTVPALQGDNYSEATAVNSSGVAVGFSNDDTTGFGQPSYYTPHGVLWQNGKATALGSLGSGYSYAEGINDLDQVVGYSWATASGTEMGFLWQNGAMTALAAVGGQNLYSRALAINDAGQIVGDSVLGDSPSSADHATLWLNGTATDLGTFAGGGFSSANAINDVGAAVGEATTAGGVQQAALFENGSVTDLGGLVTNGASQAKAINDAGTIVGNAVGSNGAEHAVMWQNGVITDLNSLLPANSGWNLMLATGISSNGQIYGEGTFNGTNEVFQLTVGTASASGGNSPITIDASAANMNIIGPSNTPTTVSFSDTASHYTISTSGSTVIVTDSGTGRTSVDQLTDITAIQFSDVTDIVAAAPGSGSTVTTGNIAELYGAVFGRLPDIAGLSFYQSYLASNPTTPLLQFAEWFLSSPEYTSNAAHDYAQTTAGDDKFITDSYENLLHRTPTAAEIAYYQTNVMAPALANLTAGTQAYSAAEFQAHAQMLVYFSASPEFLSDVQVTAQSPSSSLHWLVLT